MPMPQPYVKTSLYTRSALNASLLRILFFMTQLTQVVQVKYATDATAKTKQ